MDISAPSSDTLTRSRSRYIESFPQYFFVWPVLKVTGTTFRLQNLKDHRQQLTFRPDAIVHAGGGVFVFGIGVQVLFALPQRQENIARYGKSDALDLQANLLGKHWVIDGFTQRYQGYYKEDSSDPVLPGAPYPQRPDIHTRNLGITGAYFFNKKKFSIRSSYNYVERQLRSSGSFLLSGNFNTFKLRADSSVYTQEEQSVFGSAANFRRVNYTTIAVAPGYAYHLIIRHRFFAGAGLSVGPALNWFYFQTETAQGKRAVQLNTFFDFRFSVGYNGERVFSGITVNTQARNINYAGVRFTNSNEAIKFAVGYRFHRFGILKKNALDLFRRKPSA